MPPRYPDDPQMDTTSFMVDTLDRLAKKAESEFESAVLSALSVIAKNERQIETRMTKVEKSITALEHRYSDIAELRDANDRQDRELLELKAWRATREAEVRGGWWVAVKVSAIMTAILAGIAGVYELFKDGK